MITPESAVTFATLKEQRSSSGLEFPARRALAAVPDRLFGPRLAPSRGLAGAAWGLRYLRHGSPGTGPGWPTRQNAYLVASGGRFLL